MTLGGLWHGAAWTFVVWGVFHGLLLIGHRSFRAVCERRPVWSALLQTYPGTVLRLGLTFLAVCVGWVFFRSPTFAGAGTMLMRLLVPHGGQPAPMSVVSFYCLAGLVVACHGLAHFGIWKRLAVRLPGPALGFGYAALLTVVSLLALNGNRPFIYFQF
jgi:alginate O-acetyltransferase complex protein AlgI